MRADTLTQLLNWIKKKEKEGFTKDEIRKTLLKSGYTKEDIGDVYPSKLTFYSFFQPNVFKLILFAIVAALILLSTYANIVYLPDFLHDRAYVQSEAVESFSTALNLATQKDADPSDISFQLDRFNSMSRGLSAEDYRIYSFNYYFANWGLYKLDPFFPVPCDFPELKFESSSCRYYGSYDDYSTDSLNPRLDKESYPEVNNSSLVLNTLLLLIICYLLICCIYFFVVYASRKSNPIKWTIIGLVFLAGIVFLNYSTNDYDNVQKLCIFILIPFMIPRREKVRTILLYCFAALLALFLIHGMSEAFESLDISHHQIPYGFVNCTSYKILNETEKNSTEYYIGRNYTYEEWNVCYNPSCTVLCVREGYGLRFQLRGSNPSCLCMDRVQ